MIKLVPLVALLVGSICVGQESLPATRASAESNLGGLRVVEDDARIAILRDDQAIFTYNKQSPPVPEGIDPIYHRSGFLHPVTTPSGKIVTATFPADHAHQHGIFSAWVRTSYDGREIDFWNLAGETGRVAHAQVNSTFNYAAGSGIEVVLIHRIVQEPVIDVLQETWKVVAYPTDGTFFCFDIESTQKALTDTPLVVQEYHYGGFAVRGPVSWLQAADQDDAKAAVREPSDFLNDLGSQRVKGNHEHARWVSLYGQIDGQSASITVLSQADNLRAPQAARLHPSKPYFCFSPCVDGEFTINKAHPLVSRYRYLVSDAKPDAAWIDRQWKNWCGEQEFAPVQGVLTRRGRPLADVEVAFYPELGGLPAKGVSDAQGRYTLRSSADHQDAKVGPGIFLFSTKRWDEVNRTWSEETLPAQYSEKGLGYEVMAQPNVVNFDLSL